MRRNRRASGASSGGKHGGDGRLRPELTCFPPVVGDREVAGVSANAQHCRIRESICVHLRDLRFLRCVSGWSLCLRVFVFAMSSVSSLCLFASVVQLLDGEAATILNPYRVME